MPNPRIYLDHAASTPLLPGARQALVDGLEAAANPSSAHTEGRRAKDLLEGARTRVARMLGCRPREILFTASGTVAAQLAVRGAAAMRRDTSRRVVVSEIEHPCVQDAASALADDDFDVVQVAPRSDGHVDADAFLRAVGEDAAVASLMLANHETGTVLPVADVASGLRARGIPFVCDACLGPGRLPSRPGDLGADLIAYSGHKFGGPHGVGMLFVRRRTRLQALWNGGLQEERLHPGTENVAACAALASAVEHAFQDVEARAARLTSLLERFLERLAPAHPWSRVGGGLPGLATLELPGVEGEAAMINLDLEGIAVSTGSACALGGAEPGPTLLAMGLSRRRAASTLRICVGESNDEAEIDHAADTTRHVIERLRSLGTHR